MQWWICSVCKIFFNLLKFNVLCSDVSFCVSGLRSLCRVMEDFCVAHIQACVDDARSDTGSLACGPYHLTDSGTGPSACTRFRRGSKTLLNPVTSCCHEMYRVHLNYSADQLFIQWNIEEEILLGFQIIKIYAHSYKTLLKTNKYIKKNLTQGFVVFSSNFWCLKGEVSCVQKNLDTADTSSKQKTPSGS